MVKVTKEEIKVTIPAIILATIPEIQALTQAIILVMDQVDVIQDGEVWEIR
jgi:hypothetical protein